jgi:hypothetical protein
MSDGEGKKRKSGAKGKMEGVQQVGQTEAQKLYRENTGKLFMHLESLVPRTPSSRSSDFERGMSMSGRPAAAGCPLKEEMMKKKRTRAEIIEDCIAFVKVQTQRVSFLLV